VARKGGQITENCAEQIGGRMPGSGSVSLGKDGNGTEGEGRAYLAGKGPDGGRAAPLAQTSPRGGGDPNAGPDPLELAD